MYTILNLIMHGLILVGAFAMIRWTFKVINSGDTHEERLIRVTALLGGFLLFLGSKSVGLSVPDLLSRSLQFSRPGVSTLVIQFACPATGGALLGWFFTSAMRRPEERHFAFRVLIMLTALVISIFSEVYLVAFDVTQTSLNKNLLPNLSFIIGLILHVMRVDSFGKPADSKGADPDWRKLV